MIGDEVPNTYLLERVLVLAPENEGHAFTTKCKFHYEPQTQTINFSRTFHRLCASNDQLQRLLEHAQLFYLDERKRTKHFLGEFPLEGCRMFFDDWTASSIVISYRKHQPPPTTIYLSANACKKSRERTIREVRVQIERWRQVARENYASGPKGITLSKAARQIGMSKKSLDDYLRYLRIGEKLDFDFKAFENEKMGFLRAFVKSKLREPMENSIQREIDSYWDSTYISKEES